MIKRVLLFTCVCTLAVLSTSAQTFRNKLFPSNEISGEEFKKQAINKIQSLQNYLEVLVKNDQNTSKTAKNAAVENAVRLFMMFFSFLISRNVRMGSTRLWFP